MFLDRIVLFIFFCLRNFTDSIAGVFYILGDLNSN